MSCVTIIESSMNHMFYCRKSAPLKCICYPLNTVVPVLEDWNGVKPKVVNPREIHVMMLNSLVYSSVVQPYMSPNKAFNLNKYWPSSLTLALIQSDPIGGKQVCWLKNITFLKSNCLSLFKFRFKCQNARNRQGS